MTAFRGKWNHLIFS